MAGVVDGVMVVTGNSQNSMNKKWKLAFTPCLAGPLSLLFSRFPFARSTAAKLACRGRRRRRRAKKEKSKGRKEFNIKKLSFCVDMKIPRISAPFLRRLFSSLLPPYLLRVYRGSLRLLHLQLRIFIFTAADLSTGCSYCLARPAANRQIRLKDIDLATRAWNVLVRLRRALDQRYLLSHVVAWIMQ